MRLLIFLATLWLVLAPQSPTAPPFVWLEAEQATTNIPLEAKGWGHKEFLSGEKWVQVAIDADKVEKAFPEGGVILRYSVTIPQNATYEIWNRIGYEFARSNFDWRLDSGAWQRITPE